MNFDHARQQTPWAPGPARKYLLGLAVLLGIGCFASRNLGDLPQRETAAQKSPASSAASEPVAPDLQLYQAVVAEVRGGKNYYDSAYPLIKQFGFPVSSPFNWRLPTYAYFFAIFPGPAWIQAAAIFLAIAGLLMAFTAEADEIGFGPALVTLVGLAGVGLWTIDGGAYYTQEVWAALLILLSIGCHAQQWHWESVVAGLAALSLREHALPYCLVAATLSWIYGRHLQTVGWALGITGFFVLLLWHSSQVAQRVQLEDLNPAMGMGQWVRWGGLDFILTTARMNYFLNSLPSGAGWVLFVYVACSLIGLAELPPERAWLLLLTTTLYLAAYCVVGRKENVYWGLLYAPLLPWGWSRFCLTLMRVGRVACSRQPPLAN